MTVGIAHRFDIAEGHFLEFDPLGERSVSWRTQQGPEQFHAGVQFVLGRPKSLFNCKISDCMASVRAPYVSLPERIDTARATYSALFDVGIEWSRDEEGYEGGLIVPPVDIAVGLFERLLQTTGSDAVQQFVANDWNQVLEVIQSYHGNHREQL